MYLSEEFVIERLTSNELNNNEIVNEIINFEDDHNKYIYILGSC